MSKLYLEIFDPEREKVFDQLLAFRENGVLAGGTGLALQLGHRKSFDFDVFVPRSLSPRFFKKVVEVFGKTIRVRVSTGDILIFQTPKDIEITFVYVWYKRLYPNVLTHSIDLAAVGDLAADKAYTIGRRGQWRDYVDIFFLLKRGVFTLEKIIEDARKKYSPEFNPRLFLEQLTYYGDIHDFRIVSLEESYAPAKVQKFLTEESKKLIKKYF